MSGLSASQLLFYGGIGVMALTVLAAVLEGYSATGIEVTDAYAALSKERIVRELAQSA